MIKLFSRQTFLVMLCFCLLLGTAAVPVFLLNHRAKLLLNRPNVTGDAPEAVLLSPDSTDDASYDSLERIVAIHNSAIFKSTSTVTWELTQENEAEPELASGFLKQLAILTGLDALPKLSYEDIYQISAWETVYYDLDSPEHPIGLWQIHMTCADFYVDAFMDADTYVIYELYILSMKNALNYSSEGLSAEGFFSYLASHSQNVRIGNEYFDADGTYTPDIIHLAPISYNDDMGTVTTYPFVDTDVSLTDSSSASDYMSITESR